MLKRLPADQVEEERKLALHLLVAIPLEYQTRGILISQITKEA
jgi:hypothetical protein